MIQRGRSEKEEKEDIGVENEGVLRLTLITKEGKEN